MSFEIIYTVKPIGLMKTWGKSYYVICMKKVYKLSTTYNVGISD